MAVRWKKNCIYLLITVFSFFNTVSLMALVGSMASTQELLSISMGKIESVTSSFSPSTMRHRQEQHLAQNTQCDPLPHQPLQRVYTFRTYPNYRTISEISTITGDYDSPLAICKLDMGSPGWLRHSPVVMQHFYACYSYWLDNPSKIPVLYPLGISKLSLERSLNDDAFLKGFMDILVSRLGVQILYGVEIDDWLLDRNHTTTVVRDADVSVLDGSGHDARRNSTGSDSNSEEVVVNPKVREIHRPLGYVFSHARRLNEMAQRHYGMGQEIEEPITNKNDSSDASRTIRVGILNREASDGRSITNAEDLVKRIDSDIFGVDNNEDNSTVVSQKTSTSSFVTLVYINEKHTLEEQVRFFNAIDILVSPHGSQLTGIPLMANKDCAQLIELFPVMYYMPDFYGSLAIDSGIGYSHLYFSNETAEAQSRKYKTAVQGRIIDPDIQTRTSDRSKNLCVDTGAVVSAVKEAITEWHKCQSTISRSRPEQLPTS